MLLDISELMTPAAQLECSIVQRSTSLRMGAAFPLPQPLPLPLPQPLLLPVSLQESRPLSDRSAISHHRVPNDDYPTTSVSIHGASLIYLQTDGQIGGQSFDVRDGTKSNGGREFIMS